MTVAERSQSPPALPASVASRIAAYALDWLVTFILACLFLSAAGLLLLVATDMGRRDAPDGAIYAALIVASLVVPVWLVVTLAGWAWSGRTVGKLAMNLRVVDRDGRPPGWPRAAVRLVVYLLESLPLAVLAPAVAAGVLLRARPLGAYLLVGGAALLLLPLVSLVLALRDGAHRALHDRVAGTVVRAE